MNCPICGEKTQYEMSRLDSYIVLEEEYICPHKHWGEETITGASHEWIFFGGKYCDILYWSYDADPTKIELAVRNTKIFLAKIRWKFRKRGLR